MGTFSGKYHYFSIDRHNTSTLTLFFFFFFWQICKLARRSWRDAFCVFQKQKKTLKLYWLFCTSALFLVTVSPLFCFALIYWEQTRCAVRQKKKHTQKKKGYKSQVQTKGHWTAGYLSFHQPRCQLIAADILPLLLFQSKMIWCIAPFCFLAIKEMCFRNAILS